MSAECPGQSITRNILRVSQQNAIDLGTFEEKQEQKTKEDNEVFATCFAECAMCVSAALVFLWFVMNGNLSAFLSNFATPYCRV